MKELKQTLKNAGIRSKELLDELYDHYLESYDQLIQEGMDMQQAKLELFRQIGQIDLKTINSNYTTLYHPINSFVMYFFSLFLCLSIAYSTIDFKDPPTLNPISFELEEISSEFGERMHPVYKTKKFHKGIDIKATSGTQVVAPADGIILESAYDSKLGHYIVIQHDDEYTTRYHHLNKSIVEKDQPISAGQKIGEVGSTGMSTAPHLHYEVLKDNKNIDPREFLKV